MEIRSRFSKRVGVAFEHTLPSRTSQEYKNMTSISYLLNSHTVSPYAMSMAFVDDSNKLSYFDMMNSCASIREEFYKLPLEVRGKFDHNVAKFHDFILQKDYDKGVELGVYKKLNEPVPEPVPEKVPKAPENKEV